MINLTYWFHSTGITQIKDEDCRINDIVAIDAESGALRLYCGQEDVPFGVITQIHADELGSNMIGVSPSGAY